MDRRKNEMTKPEIVNHIANQADITKKAATMVLDTLVGTIQDTLQQNEGKIKISNLGTFRVLQKKARAGVNPRTGRKMTIPSMKVPRFYASKALKSVINGNKH
jgi:DNA-binding protein HU-beta